MISSKRPCTRLALTQRIAAETSYEEQRDALAHDWSGFLASALPEAKWLPIPNAVDQSWDTFEAFGFDALILTGGETPGSSERRDSTEKVLLEGALERGIPILAVCRGMQFVNLHFGGRLQACDGDRHISNTHPIEWLSESDTCLEGTTLPDRVNSYHGLGMYIEDVADDLQTLAICPDDGIVEAFCHKAFPLLGIMWHPERERGPALKDAELIRKFLGWKRSKV